MSFLLFPGRHLANTTFQASYLRQTLNHPLDELSFIAAPPKGLTDPLDAVIFAVTSSNQQNSRYNPIEFHIRAIGVDRFAQSLNREFSTPIRYRIVGVPHYGPTQRFARHTLKEIDDQTETSLRLTPQNTIVLCSTPEVIDQYRQLGFGVLPAELQSAIGNPQSAIPTPITLIKRTAELGEGWASDDSLNEHLHPATRSLWLDFPQVPQRIARLYRDPLLDDQGSLTGTRNYAVYTWAMSNPAAIEQKYNDIKDSIVAGKIVDEGCADAALLVPIARDFPDSDLIGIEITGEFMAQCRERQRRGDFGGTYTHFHQRNLMEDIFEPDSIDTTICNSTVHELWSYGEQEKTVREYLARKFKQTRRGGRIIIRDVVAPESADSSIWLWCDDADGSNENVLATFESPDLLRKHLDGLSTAARFLRFQHDFLREMRKKGNRAPDTAVTCREKRRGSLKFFVTTFKWAAEFLLKKDYTDSWDSEMKEEFTYWSFSQWARELKSAGFEVVAHSRDYTNPWIAKNRFENRVKLFRDVGGAFTQADWPPTNLVIIGQKKRG
jgi:hypothetical protein